MHNSEPNPENIKDLIVYANRALMGQIRPYMRKISIRYDKDDNSVTLYFYMDKPLSQGELDSDVTGSIIAELCADFSADVGWNERIIVTPFPEVIHEEGICIYSRYEEFD